MSMFNDDITKELAKAAGDVMNNSSMGDSVLSQSMIDAANNIQSDVKDATGMEQRNQIIKNTMLNTAKENNITLSPSASAEFEKRAKGVL